MLNCRGEGVCVKSKKGLACGKSQELGAAWQMPRTRPALCSSFLRGRMLEYSTGRNQKNKMCQFKTRGKAQERGSCKYYRRSRKDKDCACSSDLAFPRALEDLLSTKVIGVGVTPIQIQKWMGEEEAEI